MSSSSSSGGNNSSRGEVGGLIILAGVGLVLLVGFLASLYNNLRNDSEMFLKKMDRSKSHACSVSAALQNEKNVFEADLSTVRSSNVRDLRHDSLEVLLAEFNEIFEEWSRFVKLVCSSMDEVLYLEKMAPSHKIEERARYITQATIILASYPGLYGQLLTLSARTSNAINQMLVELTEISECRQTLMRDLRVEDETEISAITETDSKIQLLRASLRKYLADTEPTLTKLHRQTAQHQIDSAARDAGLNDHQLNEVRAGAGQPH
jgi:hypothetical protein